jgi:glycosyltransferase involved in cell wall biosynthesis
VRVALIGTRGVPARYGGFETAVEEIGSGLSERGHEVTVYCRNSSEVGAVHRGMRRVILPAVRRKAVETLTHSALSTLHALRHRPDVAIVFNAANAPFVGVLRAAGIRTVLHIDGHDERRRKWQGVGRLYYLIATRVGIALAHEVIADSVAIQRELAASYGVTSVYIPYGAHTSINGPASAQAVLDGIGLTVDGFHLLVARFEPENQVLEIVQSYLAAECELPLVLVGFSGFPSDYAEQIAAVADPRICRLGAVWDQHLLDALYAGAASYVHGHSVGGTNPSLLRAMVNGAPVIAYDCPYNRETTGGHALWFDRARPAAGAMMAKLERDESAAERGENARQRAVTHYLWADVVTAYEGVMTGQSR